MKTKIAILMLAFLCPAQSQYQNNEFLVLPYNWIAERKYKEQATLVVWGSLMSPEGRAYFQGRQSVFDELLEYAPPIQTDITK